MILTDSEIKAEIMTGRMEISDFDPTLVNPSSLDVRLGNEFYFICPTTDEPINPLDKHSFAMVRQSEGSITLAPGEFCLSTLLEVIKLPPNISSSLRGKSSLARLGLDNSSFGAWVDPGFGGSLVIELANHNHYPLLLTSGMKIGQLIFYKHEKVHTPYNLKATSRYMNQEGVQGSKGID